jgi:hypothetical protein
MRKFTVNRPSPALVIAIVALFAAMGGSAYAAATITGKNIKNNSITTSDIKTSTLRGSDVKSNTLTGSDISESSLGKVPSSSKADSADSAATAGKATNADHATAADDSGKLGGMSLRGLSQWAVVSSAGAVIDSSADVTVVKLAAAGRYRVHFASAVAKCGINANAGIAPTASDASNFANRFALVAHSSTGANDVQVEIVDDAGTEANSPFYITAQC